MSSTSSNTEDRIEEGDYVTYRVPFRDGIAIGYEEGAGYVTRIVDDEFLTIVNGDRKVAASRAQCEMRAKQLRLAT